MSTTQTKVGIAPLNKVEEVNIKEAVSSKQVPSKADVRSLQRELAEVQGKMLSTKGSEKRALKRRCAEIEALLTTTITAFKGGSQLTEDTEPKALVTPAWSLNVGLNVDTNPTSIAHSLDEVSSEPADACAGVHLNEALKKRPRSFFSRKIAEKASGSVSPVTCGETIANSSENVIVSASLSNVVDK